MKTLCDKSQFAYSTELDFFSAPPTSIGIKSHRFREIGLESTLQQNGPFHFRYCNEQHYLCLPRSYVQVVFSIVDNAGQGFNYDVAGAAGAVQPGDRVAPIQFMPRTMWSQITASINGSTVCDTGPLHSHMAYILNELHNDYDTKAYNQGDIEMYDPEDTGVSLATNPGYLTKAKMLRNGQKFMIMSTLDIPLCTNNKLILNNVDLRITLHRHPDKFILNSFNNDTEWKLKIDSVKFLACEMDIFPDASAAVEKQLAGGELAFYPMLTHVCKSHYIAPGTRQTPDIIAFSQGMQIPKKLYVAFCKQESIIGDYRTDSFEYNHNNVRSITVDALGVSHPARPWNLDYANDIYSVAIVAQREALGQGTSAKTNGINYQKFKVSKAIYVFDLSTGSTYNQSDTFDLSSGGNVSIRVEFANPVGPNGLQMVILGAFQSYMTLDRQRNPVVLNP